MTDSTRPVNPKGYGKAPSTSAALHSQPGGLSILDAAAWRQQSPFSWIHGSYTICCVRLNNKLTFELWKNSAFCARADDAATLRTIAAAGGAVA